MASNSNRDLFPVKDYNLSRSNKGVNNKIDYEILSKLSRCELEEKFLKLLDEQTHLKKLLNCQEEKIKRLGTKLLRIIGEKRNGRKNLEQSEEMQIKIIELEHENYALKDKNIVLKQQLANHSHHPSSVQSMHTSPVTMIRGNEALQNENIFGSEEKKNVHAENKIRDAETVIQELNQEIKALHCKITFLQQEIEKNSIDNRKVKVTENIELIRLQRSLKQQAIQIAALQGQVKNSEINQKILKEDLIKAHKDNEKALHLVSLKQNEILSLCAKLEEKNLSKLEENELRERINDLVLERDSLKERSDFLMKTIDMNSKDAEQVEDLQKLLAEEKLEKKKLELILEETQKKLKNCQDLTKEANEVFNCSCQENFQVDCNSASNSKNESNEIPIEILKGKHFEEKINMERELQYLRDMLKMQTSHCEAQQKEISRLMLELKVNEEKCNETLQRLDSHLKMIHLLDKNTQEDRDLKSSCENIQGFTENHQLKSSDVENTPSKSEEKNEVSKNQNLMEVNEADNSNIIKNNKNRDEVNKERSTSNFSIKNTDNDGSKKNNSRSKIELFSVQRLSSRIATPEKIPSVSLKKDNKINEFDAKKRFVDQVFLESSEEEDNGEAMNQESAVKKSSLKLEIPESESLTRGRTAAAFERQKSSNLWNPPYKIYNDDYRRNSSESISSKPLSDGSSQHETRRKTLEKIRKKDFQFLRSNSLVEQKLPPKKEVIEITILWLSIDANSSLLTNKKVKLLFVDFSFLDVKGEETETPNSLPKPKSADEKCNFNFTTDITITEEKKITLNSLLNKPESVLVIFKVVSEPDSSNEELECEDVGVAVITAKQFQEKYNAGPFVIPVVSLGDPKELIGNLAVNFQGSY